MVVGKLSELKGVKVNADNVKGAAMKVLVGPEQGWEDHVMRVLEVEAGGYTPRHTHDWPHINYVIKGKGILHLNGEDKVIEAGSYAYVPSNILHQFQNTGEEPLEFICIVPKKGHA